MELKRDGDGLGRAVTVLAQDQVGLIAARAVALERVRTVQPHVDPAAGAPPSPVTRVPLRSPQLSMGTPDSGITRP